VEETDKRIAIKILSNLVEAIENGGLVDVRVMKTNRNNTTFWLDIRHYYTNRDGWVQEEYLNWTYATLLALPLNDRGWVKGKGLGISRALQVQINLEYLIKRYLDTDISIRIHAN
jgi:hypothetical protein